MEPIKSIVQNVVELLVQKNYRELALLTGGARLSENEIGRAISEYGRTLVALPDSAFELLDVVEVTTPRIMGVRQWNVVMPFWTKEEGRSDLSIELTILDARPTKIELDGLRVR